MAKLYFLFLILLLSFYSCETFNPEEPKPGFINIDEINVDAGFKQGTDSVDISTCWIYIDDNLVGAYELPVELPILEEGVHDLKIRPGIIVNGIGGTRSVNPFIEDFTTEVDFYADSVYTFNPTLNYVEEANFVWNDKGEEAFEDGGISIDSLAGSFLRISKTTDEVYEGMYSGLIKLDTNQTKYLGASTTEFDIPSNPTTILEIHIKNPVSELKIGTYDNYNSSSVVKTEFLVVNPSDNWRKIFVNLSPHIANISSARHFKVYFEANLPSDIDTANIYIDNIKLLQF